MQRLMYYDELYKQVEGFPYCLGVLDFKVEASAEIILQLLHHDSAS